MKTTLITLFALLSILGGCGTYFSDPPAEQAAAAPAPTPNSSIDPQVAAASSLELRNTMSTTLAPSFYLHRSGLNNMSADCKISQSLINTTPTSSIVEGDRDITCYLEAEELDLYFNGLDLQLIVPAGTCQYVRYTGYWFWQWRPGITNTAALAAVNPTAVRVDKASGCSGGGYLAMYDNTQAAADACMYNWTNSGGPNCDKGSFTVTNNSYTEVSTTTGTCNTVVTTTTKVECGGLWANCSRGPGKETAECGWGATDKLPCSKIYNSVSGLKQPWTYAPDISNRATNRYMANYTRRCSRDTLEAHRRDTVGLPADNSMGPLDPFHYAPEPFYRIECLDRAREVKARIRLQVRDWDVTFAANATYRSALEEGTTQSATQTSVNGLVMDRNSIGNETSGIGYWNDQFDWDDNMSTMGAQPGNTPLSCGTSTQSFDFPESSL